MLRTLFNLWAFFFNFFENKKNIVFFLLFLKRYSALTQWWYIWKDQYVILKQKCNIISALRTINFVSQHSQIVIFFFTSEKWDLEIFLASLINFTNVLYFSSYKEHKYLAYTFQIKYHNQSLKLYCFEILSPMTIKELEVIYGILHFCDIKKICI